MNRTLPLVLLALLALSAPRPAAAQEDRAALIAAARAELSDSVRMDLLLRALRPETGPRDSLWTVAGYQVAAELAALDRAEDADVWVRWLVRHGREWPMDRSYFLLIANRYEEALRVAAEPEPDGVTTDWRWPPTFDPDRSGSVEVSVPDVSDPVRVSVGPAVGSAGEGVAVARGTHVVEIAADGYEPLRLTREVLPGVTTLIRADLVPVLGEGESNELMRALVEIRVRRGAIETCGSGLLVAPDGLILTTWGTVRDATLTVSGPGLAAPAPARVAAFDEAEDMAVLKTDANVEPIDRSAGVGSSDYAWARFAAGCGDLRTVRTRIAESGAANRLLAEALLPSGSAGGPLVDHDGRLIGMVRAEDRYAPIELAADLLEQARRPVGPVVADGGQVSTGGFPWLWVAGGAVAAGAAAVLLGGGGGSGGNGGPAGPTTGGIVLTIPN